MKKLLLPLLATGALLAFAGGAMAQTSTAPNAPVVAADQAADPNAVIDPTLLPDAQAAAKLHFKIKGVAVDDDEDGASENEGQDHESGGDNG
ncbi:MAG: hypothetical protein KGO53_14090 [Alphaproteobacteria bacterium]|nr:hypothetical protein [Alphaproteobacteria bacterium]